MYQSPFLGLDEAANLFARVLRKTHANAYPDDALALEEGRRELVQALFDGTVRSEGVRSELPQPPPPEQSGPFPDPSSSEWVPIERGWWSNLRYEKLTCAKPDNTEAFGIDWKRLAVPLEAASDPTIVERENSLPQEGIPSSDTLAKYQIDQVVVNWADDSFEIDDNHGSDWFYAGIRVWRADVEKVLGTDIGETQNQPSSLGQSSGVRESSGSQPRKRLKTKPDPVRISVYSWLNECYENEKRGQDWIMKHSAPWLSREYHKLPEAKGSLGHIRKLVVAWRQDHPEE